MTDNSDKIRSIVLAALMVFSVFAGTIALSGGAAAATATTWSTTSADDVTIGESSYEQTLEVDFELDASGEENVTLDLSGYQDQIDFNDFSASTDNTDVAVEDTNLDSQNDEFTFDLNNTGSGAQGGVLTITADLDTQDASTNSGTSLTVSAEDAGSDGQFQFDVVNADGSVEGDVRKATHYVSNDANVGATIEVAFSNDVSGSEDFTVGFDDGTEETLSTSYESNGRVLINTSGNVYSDVQNVTVPDSVTAGDGSETVDVTFAPTTVFEGGDETDGYIGSNIAFEASSTDTSIDFDGPDFTPTRGTGAGSHVYVVDTDNFEAGTYNATIGGTDTSSIELTSLGLGVTADDVATDEDVTATVESNDINRDVDVELLDSNDEVVDDTTVSIDSDGQATANFGQQDAGNYSVVATDVSTEVEANDSLTVSEADDAQATFTDNTYNVAQGGIAEIGVELTETTEGTIVIGDEADDGYQANVTFIDDDEDGEVTIQFNTYVAGDSSGSNLVSAEGDDTAELIDGTNSETTLGPTDLLGQGGYDLAVDTGHAANGSVVTTSGDADFGSLSINERSTDGMTLWTAPSGTNADDLLDAATEDSTIATGDWVVHQVEASGLSGLVDGDLSAAFGEGVNVSVQQTEATTRQNRQPKSLDVDEALDDGDISLIADAENESYYIALDSSTDAFERSAGANDDDLSAGAGEDYTATFTVDDEKLVGPDDEDHESVNATFEVVEGAATLDMTPVNLTATENAEITGTSTLAPGSEFRVVVESTGGISPRFYNNPPATVQDDGTWNVTVDLSEQSTGDTFEVRSDYFDTANGQVVESVSDETPTETDAPDETDTATATDAPSTDTDAPSTDTDAPSTDTDEPDTETTTTTTPGFGVAVALVALLAAALLAGRRE